MSRRSIHSVAAEPLNTLLAEKALHNTPFTVCELRDALLEQPDLTTIDHKMLRRYVRNQINLRVKRGEVEWVGVHPHFKQRHFYRMVKAQADALCIGSDPGSKSVEPLVALLSRDSEQLRERMEACDLQLQALQEIAKKYPCARDKIIPLFEQEKGQARALGEKLKAYSKVQQKLAEVGDDV
ncbi:hypothetical protein ACE3G8_16955 [Vreelandella venusta]